MSLMNFLTQTMGFATGDRIEPFASHYCDLVSGVTGWPGTVEGETCLKAPRTPYQGQEG